MVWKELIPKIEYLLRRHPPPKFIVIQLGSHDLGTVKGWKTREPPDEIKCSRAP
jgi:hypothetical protein